MAKRANPLIRGDLENEYLRRESSLRSCAAELAGPHAIQQFLNSAAYSTHATCVSPYHVMRGVSAHCAEGAYFAAAMLRYLGHTPLVVDLHAENDDDHVIALFRDHGRWGAIAKSNTTMLRYREPVYATLRELVMSYFEMYFNTHGTKSLRSYSRPVSLARFDRRRWVVCDDDLEYIGDFLTSRPHTRLVTPAQAALLAPADPDLMEACFAGADPEGLFVPT